MQVLKRDTWRILSNESNLNIFDQVQNRAYEVVSILKDDYRSRVYHIKLLEQDLVLKIPNEKNTRWWIRFLTWFRIGEAFKNIEGMSILHQLGISTTKPFIAAEKRSFGMVVDSWLVFEYLDGESCLGNDKHYPMVVKKLREMHNKGILHGDPQIRNFMYFKDIIYVIDSNPKSAGLFGFSKAYEFAYLKKSAPGIELYFGTVKNSKWYQWSVLYDIYDRKLARFRKRVKKPFKKLFRRLKKL